MSCVLFLHSSSSYDINVSSVYVTVIFVGTVAQYYDIVHLHRTVNLILYQCLQSLGPYMTQIDVLQFLFYIFMQH